MCFIPSWSRPESNWDIKFRRLAYYPLYYETGSAKVTEIPFPQKVYYACFARTFSFTVTVLPNETLPPPIPKSFRLMEKLPSKR